MRHRLVSNFVHPAMSAAKYYYIEIHEHTVLEKGQKKKDIHKVRMHISPTQPTCTLPDLIKSLSPAMRVKLMNYVCTAGLQ